MQVSWIPLRAIRASSRISSRYRPEQSRTQTGSSPRCSPAAGRAARATGPSPRHSSGCAVGAHEGAALFHPHAAARWDAAESATDDQAEGPSRRAAALRTRLSRRGRLPPPIVLGMDRFQGRNVALVRCLVRSTNDLHVLLLRRSPLLPQRHRSPRLRSRTDPTPRPRHRNA
jgi:hypothetical protein